MSMRGAVERIVDNISVDEIKACELLLEVSDRSLAISLGLSIADHYTICIYISEKDSDGRDVLRCVAHRRTVDCPIEEARKWPSGVGVAGAALARGVEVVVPDLTAQGIGTLYSHLQKPADGERYRSIVAVPIILDDPRAPWGVAVGTSDVPGHFSVGDWAGLQTAEPIRALAGMAALAVKIVRSQATDKANTASVGVDTTLEAATSRAS
ncbi:MAG: hypothetical protein K0S00_3885 [Xanthobacteraceae bacterium]|jgi:GAF domain-containing protein|nr:hypothetical protein [Xanthobacteraceae bacterium]